MMAWKDIAMGPRSWKALRDWRQSMIPIMKHELESRDVPVPNSYIDLVSTYVRLRAHKSFLFNFFLAWHAKYHSKGLRQTVIERNAYIFHKKRLTVWSLRLWLNRVRDTKAYLKTPEKWDKYIHLVRSQHMAEVRRTSVIVNRWHSYARGEALLKKREIQRKEKMLKSTFQGWQVVTIKHREMKMEAVMKWKMYIADPRIAVVRRWRLYALKRRTRKAVYEQLDESHRAWKQRVTMERLFGKWQRRMMEEKNKVRDLDLQRRHWKLQATKHETSLLSSLYAKEREKIAQIETELGDVTTNFVRSEEEVGKLEEISTTWKIALHALKMELLRLGLVIEKCGTAGVKKKRRMSSEDSRDRLNNDDRYGKEARTRLGAMHISDRVVGTWKRRNSDPDLASDEKLMEMKPPLDDIIVQLLSIEKE
jgi:hypothetical protein